nr:uncharacterized protein LOC129388372 [Dermacentor andersoni]
MSKHTGSAHRGGVSVTLYSNWIEKPDSDDARRKKNQADFVLTFSTIDRKPILKVAATAVNEFTAMVQGAYEILKASEKCVVLRGPQHLRGGAICTVWVLKSTAQQNHDECKSAFLSLCQSTNTCPNKVQS